MINLKKRKLWVPALIITLFTLSISFFSETNSVRAMLGNTYTADVLIRFINEILLKSQAGQYYIDLSLKHSDDLNRIYTNTPDYLEHREKLIYVIQIFTPGMDALLDGKGDTVQITKEQISLLQTELEWVASVAEPPLQEDIEKELQRFPLENFINMTMSEALDYVNSNFPANMTSDSTIPSLVVTSQVIPTPMCLIGFDVICQEMPLPTSDNQWVYYVHQGIYFEFPSNWQVQYSSFEQMKDFAVLPLPDSSSEGNIRHLNFTFLDLQNAPIENWDQAIPFLLSQRSCSDANWEIIQVNNFQGFECFLKYEDLSVGSFRFFLYNENQRIAIDFRATVEDEQLTESTNDLNAINKIFPNIQHIIESIRIWNP